MNAPTLAPTFDAVRYVTMAATAETPYAFAALDGLDTGTSSCRKRAAEMAASICRQRKQVVLFLEPKQMWQLTPVAGRAMWTAAEGRAA